MFDRIKETLRQVRVDIDIWFSEASLHDSGAVAEAVARARAGGHVYERDGATWLATSAFGDDKDRVILRANGGPTYFAADLAYIDVKFRRGHERVFYVLGATTTATSVGWRPPRPASATTPAGRGADLPARDGVRGADGEAAGNVVFADELVEAIGVDAARYFLVQRSHDQVMDIDLDLAAERSQKNPVYYVQYAHARVSSILRRAAEEAVAVPAVGSWSHEPEPGEAALVKRLAEWPEVAADAAARRAPHKVLSFAHDLAADFHVFHHNHRVLHEDPDVRGFRLALTEATGTTIRGALHLVGVEAPESM
jgi:arginyl-tRNA synthetase